MSGVTDSMTDFPEVGFLDEDDLIRLTPEVKAVIRRHMEIAFDAWSVDDHGVYHGDGTCPLLPDGWCVALDVPRTKSRGGTLRLKLMSPLTYYHFDRDWLEGLSHDSEPLMAGSFRVRNAGPYNVDRTAKRVAETQAASLSPMEAELQRMQQELERVLEQLYSLRSDGREPT